MDCRINSLQNYYGDVIRRNKGDLEGMIKALQVSLHYTLIQLLTILSIILYAYKERNHGDSGK